MLFANILPVVIASSAIIVDVIVGILSAANSPSILTSFSPEPIVKVPVILAASTCNFCVKISFEVSFVINPSSATKLPVLIISA